MEWNLLKILSKFDISLKAQPWLQCVITSNQNQAFRNQKYSIFIYIHDKFWNSGLRNPVETFSSWNTLLFLIEQESLKKTEWANCFSGFLQGMSDLWPSNCLILIEKKTPCKSLWQMAGFGVLGGVTLFFFLLGNSWHLPNDILPFFINCHMHCGKNFPLPKGVKCIWTLSNVLSMKNPHH